MHVGQLQMLALSLVVGLVVGLLLASRSVRQDTSVGNSTKDPNTSIIKSTTRVCEKKTQPPCLSDSMNSSRKTVMIKDLEVSCGIFGVSFNYDFKMDVDVSASRFKKCRFPGSASKAYLTYLKSQSDKLVLPVAW